MLETFLLATATTACATYTFSTSGLFAKARVWLVKHLPGILKMLITCQYCLSHWVGMAVLLLLAPKDALWLWLPVVWAASHSLTLFTILLNVVPFWQSSVQASYSRAVVRPVMQMQPTPEASPAVENT
jgi:hypothetical protein